MSRNRLNRSLELTRRIDDEDAAAINLALNQLEHFDEAIAQLTTTLNEGRWEDKSITDIMMPYVALLAHQEDEDRLSLAQLSTLLFFWSASKLYSLRAVTPNQPEFKEAIAATLRPNFPLLTSRLKQQAPNLLTLRAQYSSQLSDEQMMTFFSAVERLPKSEQVIFVYNETINPLTLEKSTEVTDALTRLNFSVLYRSQILFRVAKKIAEMKNPAFANPLTETFLSFIPSISMMQLYLLVKFGTQAVAINPVLGLSSLEDIRQNGLTATRDMALHFPGVKLPGIADNFSAKWFRFTWHDFYHAFSASAISRRHQKLFISLSDTVKDYLENNQLGENEANAITTFINNLIDMEHAYYRSLYTLLTLSTPQESEAALFLLTVTSLLSRFIRPYLATAQERRVQLSKDTTQGLFNTLCGFILRDTTIREAMPAYNDVINRNFATLFRPAPNDKIEHERIITVATTLSRSWQTAVKAL